MGIAVEKKKAWSDNPGFSLVSRVYLSQEYANGNALGFASFHILVS